MSTCDCNKCLEQEDPVESPSRRKMLGTLVAVINLIIASAVIAPVVWLVVAPLRRRRAHKWVPLLDESELPDGTTREQTFTVSVLDGYHTVDRQYTLYLRRQGSEVMAIDPACTHLGCRVNYQQDKQRFFCPCHGGVFDAEGKVVSGPPPKALERHAVKVENGRIWVRKEV